MTQIRTTIVLLFTLSLLPVMAVLLLVVWVGERLFDNPVSPIALKFGKAILAFINGRLRVWARGQKKTT